jgi:hypothetical protein
VKSHGERYHYASSSTSSPRTLPSCLVHVGFSILCYFLPYSPGLILHSPHPFSHLRFLNSIRQVPNLILNLVFYTYSCRTLRPTKQIIRSRYTSLISRTKIMASSLPGCPQSRVAEITQYSWNLYRLCAVHTLLRQATTPALVAHHFAHKEPGALLIRSLNGPLSTQ